VKRARRQLLARAGLARNERAPDEGRDALNGGEDLLHGGSGADHAVVLA
jgi:hypothetical protein